VLTTGATRTNETVGTGDGTSSDFYLDHAYVIADSYTLFYGSSASSTAEFTEITHYALTKDSGSIVLTSAGITALSTNNIYSKYSHCELEFTDTQLQEALDKAQSEIDARTDNHWATGTDETPDYIQVTNEKHTGKGKYDRDYYLKNFPIPDVSTDTAIAITAADTTIYVDSTTGFATTGSLGCEEDRMEYTGKTSTAFTGCTSVSAHSINERVYPYVLEFSTTTSGSTAVWRVMETDADVDLDLQTGRVHVYHIDYDASYYATQYPIRNVPNRLRATYPTGNESIPSDIKRLCLMIAAKDIMGSTLRRSVINGQSGDRSENVDFDDIWIENTIERYSNIQTSNI